MMIMMIMIPCIRGSTDIKQMSIPFNAFNDLMVVMMNNHVNGSSNNDNH